MLLRERDGPRPALQLLICPVLDVLRDTGSRHALRQGYFVEPRVFERDLRDYCAAGVDPRDSRVSPLMATDFAGLPAAIVHTAEFDPFGDEGRAYACALVQTGVAAREVRHAGMIHYFYAMARAIPYAEQAARMIGSGLREALGDVNES
jgi:acetyl esterase/lipase